MYWENVNNSRGKYVAASMYSYALHKWISFIIDTINIENTQKFKITKYIDDENIEFAEDKCFDTLQEAKDHCHFSHLKIFR